MSQDRESLKIVVVGHVDHGKSTVIGRLLYDTKSIPEGAIDRVKRISKEKGKPFEYAYLLDAFEEEQKQGITIDTTQLQFHTDKRDYVIIDAPGHKEFLKNMVSGAANAEAALLIIDAHEGIQEQSKRHGYILSLLGIQKVYVLVNKMDLIDYSEEKFNQIRQEMNQFLNSLNVYPLHYIPVSAFYGENIAAATEKMPWYKGEPLLKAIDEFERDRGLEDKALRFPIQDVYKFDHRRIIAGRIESGTLRLGDEILISPSNKVTRVKSIEHWLAKDEQDVVSAGMSVGITVEDEFFNQRGEFISHKTDVPIVAEAFKANLFWLGKQPLVKQKEYLLKLATQEVECEIHSISKVVDATTLEMLEDAGHVKTNDVAEVIIKTKRSISFDEFKNNPNTGRFVLLDGYDVSGGGIVSGPVEDVVTGTKFADQEQGFEVTCFDEYYYAQDEQTVRKVSARSHIFKAGDSLPVMGDTYAYPFHVDVIDRRSRTVALIRNGRLERLVPAADYDDGGTQPLIDTVGSYIRVNSGEEYRRFLAELDVLIGPDKQRAAFAADRWIDFGRFRQIRYVKTVELSSVEYHI